jgi:O-antigen/teichoic acid export membrane protein
MVDYGFPLIFHNFATLLLRAGDHYLIGYFLTATDVAMYSVPYNLCAYITDVSLSAFQYAFIPVIMNEWSSKGSDDIQKQVQQIIKIYLLVTIPVVCGISILGEKIIVLMASDKYAGAHHILPYIMAGEGIKGLMLPLTVGLQFSKKTRIIAQVTGMCALLNISMNLYAIPAWKLQGAAITTVICYSVLVFISYRVSSKYFVVHMPWKSVFTYTLSASIMCLCLVAVSLVFHVSNLFLLIVAGVSSYSACILAIDSEVRYHLYGYIYKR